MKKIIIYLVLAIACAKMKAAAQYVYKPNEFRTTDSMPFRYRFDIYLGNKNHLQLELSSMKLLPGLVQMDSIVQAALHDLAAAEDSTEQITNGRKVEIYTDSFGVKTMRIKDTPGEKTFTFMKDGIAMLKVAQDTLVIGKSFGRTNPAIKFPPDEWKISFIVNNLADISRYTNGILDSAMQRVRSDFAKASGWTAGNDRRISINAQYVSGTGTPVAPVYQARTIHYNLALFGEVVVQNINQVWSPSFVFPAASIYYDKNNIRTMFEMGTETFLAFETNAAGRFSLQPNTFINLGFTRKAINNGPRLSTWTYALRNISLGILVNRKGDFFEKNTFRIKLIGLNYKTFSINPQFFFHDLFKDIQPSVRIGIGF